MNTSKHKKIKAFDFDTAFEKNDVTKHLDLKSIKACYPVQHVNAGFPKNTLAGVSRKSLKRAKE